MMIREKLNYKIVMGGFLVALCLVIGVVLTVLGIWETAEQARATEDYVAADGYFVDYELYDSDEDDATYRLIYRYRVDGKSYLVKTDYGTGSIPEAGHIREVRYDPKDPRQAVLSGTNSKNGLIYFGVFFILGALVFIIGALTVMGCFDRVKIDVMGTFVGMVCLVIGVGFFLFQKGESGSLPETFRALGIWSIVPVLFVAVGIFQIIKCLFFYKKS